MWHDNDLVLLGPTGVHCDQGPGPGTLGHNQTSCRDYFNILDHKLGIDSIETIDIIDTQTNDAENITK